MSGAEAVVTFACEAQEEIPLRQAAYRMAEIATCHVDILDGRWVCTLTASGLDAPGTDLLRARFLAVLNDENLREQIERRTAPLRDVIVALAFGALVRDDRAAA